MITRSLHAFRQASNFADKRVHNNLCGVSMSLPVGSVTSDGYSRRTLPQFRPRIPCVVPRRQCLSGLPRLAVMGQCVGLHELWDHQRPSPGKWSSLEVRRMHREGLRHCWHHLPRHPNTNDLMVRCCVGVLHGQGRRFSTHDPASTRAR